MAQGYSGNITEQIRAEEQSEQERLREAEPVPGPMGEALAFPWERRFSYNDDILHLGIRIGRCQAVREQTSDWRATAMWLDGIWSDKTGV